LTRSFSFIAHCAADNFSHNTTSALTNYKLTTDRTASKTRHHAPMSQFLSEPTRQPHPVL